MTDSITSPRLLIVSQGIDGGIAPLASTLAAGLRAEGWDCAVRYIGRPSSSAYVPVDLRCGVDSKAITTGKARTLAEAWGLLRSIGAIWRVVRERRPDCIIFAGFIPALLYPPILRLVTSAKFIFWDHAPQNTFLRIKKVLFPLSLRYIDRIVSISRSTAAAMTEYFGVGAEKLTVIANGVEPGRWQQFPRAADFSALRVIMPARCDLNQKDPITLIQAAAQLRGQGTDISVTLVGSGVDAGRIREAIKTEGAADYIRLIPHSDDVPALVARHNVICLSTKFEGLPTVIIEGMLARRIVVASRVAGCVDVIRDGKNGFLFEPGSVGDCADKLLALTRLSDANRIIEDAYHEAVELYSPQAMIKNFKRVLAECSASGETADMVPAPNK